MKHGLGLRAIGLYDGKQGSWTGHGRLSIMSRFGWWEWRAWIRGLRITPLDWMQMRRNDDDQEGVDYSIGNGLMVTSASERENDGQPGIHLPPSTHLLTHRRVCHPFLYTYPAASSTFSQCSYIQILKTRRLRPQTIDLFHPPHSLCYIE